MQAVQKIRIKRMIRLGGRDRYLSLDLNSAIAMQEVTGLDPLICVREMSTGRHILAHIVGDGNRTYTLDRVAKEVPTVVLNGEAIEVSPKGTAGTPVCLWDGNKLTFWDPLETKEGKNDVAVVSEGITTAERLKHFKALLWACMISDNESELANMAQHKSLQLVGSWVSLAMVPRVTETLMATVMDYVQDMVEDEFEGQLAPFVASPDAVVGVMVEMGEVKDKHVAELGAGDGRLVTAALNGGASTVLAIEKQDDRAAGLVAKFKSRPNVTVEKIDIREADLSHIDVVMMYLLQTSNELLFDKLMQELPAGAIVISHDFEFKAWIPVDVRMVPCADKPHRVFKYVK